MGVFYERVGGPPPESLVPVDTVRSVVERGLQSAPPLTGEDLVDQTDALVAEARASAPVAADAGEVRLQGQRLLIAAGLVALLVVAGIVTEANGWSDSSTAIWTLATTAFGVIVGLLGGDAKK